METIKTLKGYELHERIGSGGFGVVYRAYQTTVGREVAIKIILPHYANHPDFIRRFETEAQFIARLEHPYIVPLYDYWRDPEGAYLVMRWLRGGSLRELLAQGALEPDTAARLLDQIAAALDLAHRHNVVHRDLKPANILLDEDGNGYLSDFGIAKDVGDPQSGVTGTDMIIGSPDYLAPEQARSDPVTPQTDIYSLGVMLYEMLAGAHPFPDKTPVERMYQHLNTPLPFITTLPDDLRDDLNAIIQKATAKNPAHRYNSTLEMAGAVREVLLAVTQSGGTQVEQLTLREQEILQLIAGGCSNQEIAQRLFVTVATVKWHVWQMYRKLRVRSRVQAIARAREMALMLPTAAVPADVLTDATLIVQPEPENPYKGLRAFQTADARDFFGREKLVQRLVKRLSDPKQGRFLAVVGPSGSGKSSAVRAGLIPALWRGDIPGSGRWFIVEMIPGARPLDEMEVALTRIAATYSDNLREHLERDENGLLRVAGLILPNDGSELVIVVDQFEEVFTLVEDESRRTHFLDLLHAAVTDPRSRVRVVITLRADFYDRPLNYAHFGELVRVHMETVLPLSAEELESAIVQPAAQVGVSFEPGLVATIISDSHYQPGALPLLQYALTELFEQRNERKLTQAAYQTLGGAVGALAKRADELYLEQSLEGREAIRQMFLRLVTLGEEAEDTRRRVSRGELLAVATNDGDLMDEVIDTYAAYRLLTLDHDPATRSPTVEMAHEAILREWERLRGWLDTSRLDIRQQRLLAAAAADWHKANQDPSYLLRGARLDQFAAWAADAPIALTTRERSFLYASLAQQSHEAESERERQAKELALARRAAESQRRAVNRLRIMVAGLVVFLLGAMSLALFALGQRNDAEAARNNERTARAQAEDSLRRTNAQRLGLESLSLVQTDGESNLIGLLAVQSITTNYTPQGDAAIQAAMLQQYPRHVFTSSYGAGAPFSLVLSPDEMFVAVILDGVALEVWNVETGESVLSSEEFDAIFLPDGHLATLRLDGTIYVWDLQTREATLVITLNDILGPRDNHLNILPDTNTLIIAGTTGWVVLVNAKTGDEIARFMTYPDAHWRDMTVSPDGTKLLLIGANSYARLWDIETQQEIRNYYNNGEIGWKVAFAPDGQTIATATGAGLIRIWELDSPDAPLLTFNPHSNYVQGMAFSPDGTVLASSGADTRVHFWDVITGAEVHPPLVHSTATRWVLFSPDGQRVFSCSEDGLVWVWEVNPHFAFPEFNSPIAHQHGDAFSPDGTLLAKLNMKRLSFYDVATWTEVAYYETTQDNFLNGVTFSPDGRYVAFGTSSKTVQLWDVQAETIVQTYSGLDDFSCDVAVSSDNRYIAAGDFSGRLVVWNVESGVAVFSTTLDKQVYSVNFSPDGRFLLSTGWTEGKARLWNTTTWQEVWNLPMVSHEADAAFSPDGRFFVLGGGGIMLSLWEVDTLTKVWDFAGHYKDIMSVDFSRNGKYILSGGQDGTARLWDVETGIELRQFGVSTEVAAHVLFAPDGKYVLVTDNSLSRLWSTSIQDSIDYLCAHITRDLTEQERDLYEIKTDAPTCPGLTK